MKSNLFQLNVGAEYHPIVRAAERRQAKDRDCVQIIPLTDGLPVICPEGPNSGVQRTQLAVVPMCLLANLQPWKSCLPLDRPPPTAAGETRSCQAAFVC
jgi:hypothetical protein